MACTATVSVTGVTTELTAIVTQLTTMNGYLSTMATNSTNMLGTSVLGDFATLVGAMTSALTSTGSPLGILASAIIGGILQTTQAGSGGTVSASAQALINALVQSGYTLPLADRISPDLAASLAQRIVQGDTDPPFTDLGAVADRIAPTPTDAQCEAADSAWSTQPTTDNVADNIESLQFGAQPYTP